MKFVELNKSLKQKIANIYNLKGDDYFLIKQAISAIKSATIKDLEEFNYTKVDVEKVKAKELTAILLSLPMGNDYRMVVLENLTTEAVKTINGLELDKSTVLVTINAEKINNSETVDCTKLDRDIVTKYVLNNLAKNKVSIERQALEYLLDVCELEMTKITNELNKLISYVGEGGTIDITVATNLISSTSDYVIFMLTNAIDTKNYTNYQKILNEMSKAQSMSDIFSYMGRYFRRMYYISLSKNDDELTKILNLKPFAIKKSRESIGKNGIKFYINLYHKYVDLDYKIKSGKITPENALYELVF